ncbi:cupin domain-containing protein [Granulicella tundricola]|nr:hypothetical protein [Granulicella tundricola]
MSPVWVRFAAGYWHELINESGADAYFMPIQDAGMHSYLRTLDIPFYRHD